MAVFDPKQLVVLINGVQIQDFGEKGDALTFTPGVDAGAYTMGVDGSGTFVADPDRSASLVLNMKQHSPDNKYLGNLAALQRDNIKAFTPITLEIRDLLNEDVVTATRGYFTTMPTFARGTNANNTVWTIVFERHVQQLQNGFGN